MDITLQMTKIIQFCRLWIVSNKNYNILKTVESYRVVFSLNRKNCFWWFKFKALLKLSTTVTSGTWCKNNSALKHTTLFSKTFCSQKKTTLLRKQTKTTYAPCKIICVAHEDNTPQNVEISCDHCGIHPRPRHLGGHQSQVNPRKQRNSTISVCSYIMR